MIFDGCRSVWPSGAAREEPQRPRGAPGGARRAGAALTYARVLQAAFHGSGRLVRVNEEPVHAAAVIDSPLRRWLPESLWEFWLNTGAVCQEFRLVMGITCWGLQLDGVIVRWLGALLDVAVPRRCNL